jgi:phosphomevalonate kinase
LRPVGASAPGKALLCGEYAVLEGAPAIVGAVDRRVVVAWSEDEVSMSPEVALTLRLAREECGPTPSFLTLDASALQRDGVKLGLGSSAAAAAATAAAVFATHGHRLGDPQTLHRVFQCALAGHASVAPQGSGADVAASTFGGFLRYSRKAEEVEVRDLHRPEALTIRLVWTVRPARTSELVAKVRAFGRRDPNGYRRCMDRLAELATAFAAAFESGSAPDVIARGASYAKALAALGEAAGAPIVEGRLRRAADLAARFAGSAKPSGAGGGDLAVAFFPEESAARSFEAACMNEGLRPIEVSWEATGVQPVDGGGPRC